MWQPNKDVIESSNLQKLVRERGAETFDELHSWSINQPEEFWARTIETLGIRLHKPYSKVLDLTDGLHRAKWLTGAEFNIAESCLQGARDSIAVITRRQDGTDESITLEELSRLSNRVAGGLQKIGLQKGAAVAICMPMTLETVAIYLGILQAGMCVISVPDSCPAEEISKRLKIGNSAAVFTQYEMARGAKTMPMYEKVRAASAPITIVLASKQKLSDGKPPDERAMNDLASSANLRDGDLHWSKFLCDSDAFDTAICKPDETINILFSSGTTGDPKAIPWDHTTPIKCASDAHYHHDIRAGDVVCWPTNLGWMMGPWLIFASLINRATIAIFEGTPIGRGFCEFVQDARVTMLGLVPSIVKGWRTSGCAEGFDWSSVRAFSSTGEASISHDYAWLMQLNQPAGVLKPVIEYCGGTEVGGGYIANNILTSQNPSEFNGKVMGVDFVVLNENQQPCAANEAGEVFLVPPSIGLSTRLLNNDNDAIYCANCPRWNGKALRRHGDRMIALGNGRFQSDGRADNTMNLGGIKIGSMEIERVVNLVPGVSETAAIGIPPSEGGPDRLIIYSVLDHSTAHDGLKSAMQAAIREHLNPLFRIHEIVPIDSLPRTSSNKIMHKELRALYRANES